MAQTDWTPEGQLEDQIWLAMSPFFGTFLWWLHHGITCVVWRTTTRENLCYITLRSGTWDGDPKLPLGSYLHHVWVGHSFLLCAIGLVGSDYCFMWSGHPTWSAKWQTWNLDPWRPNLRRFPENFGDLSGRPPTSRPWCLELSSKSKNLDLIWSGNGSIMYYKSLRTYTNRVWSIILKNHLQSIYACKNNIPNAKRRGASSIAPASNMNFLWGYTSNSHASRGKVVSWELGTPELTVTVLEQWPKDPWLFCGIFRGLYYPVI